jgi:hypothetical protein
MRVITRGLKTPPHRLAALATLIPLAVAGIHQAPLNGFGYWIITSLCLAAVATATACVASLILVMSEKGISAWVYYLTVIGPFSIAPAAIIVTVLTEPAPVLAAAGAFVFVAPVVSCWLPYGKWPLGERLGLGNAVRSLASMHVTAKIQRFDDHIRLLRGQVTELDLSAARPN